MSPLAKSTTTTSWASMSTLPAFLPRQIAWVFWVSKKFDVSWSTHATCNNQLICPPVAHWFPAACCSLQRPSECATIVRAAQQAAFLYLRDDMPNSHDCTKKNLESLSMPSVTSAAEKMSEDQVVIMERRIGVPQHPHLDGDQQTLI